MKRLATLAAAAALMGLAACGGGDEKQAAGTVNVYNWSDYIDPDLLKEFEAETKLKVVYDTFDSNEVQETKVLTGGTGYDVVTPSNHNVPRYIQAKAIQPLDKSKLPNIGNLWPEIMRHMEPFDPGQKYTVPYMWGTIGIGYNKEEVAKRLPGVAIDSWDVVFKPENLAKLADCGVHFLDASEDMYAVALKYLGKDPNSTNEADYAAATDLLLKVRPHVRKFHSSEYIDALANGDICIAIGYSGDVLQAADRASEAKAKHTVGYAIPKEGSQVWFDVFAIPADAKNVDAAYQFLNYMLKPDVAARASNFTQYANANLASQSALDPEVKNNPNVYPTPEVFGRLFVTTTKGQDLLRVVNRDWTRVHRAVMPPPKPVERAGSRVNIGAVRSSFAPWKDPAQEPLVRFEGVTKRFGETLAVDDVSLSIYEREFFALLGPSGCGKTTLMRMLAGFEEPDAGRILLAGQDLSGIPPHKRPVNMMFQSYAIFPHLSVEKNIAFGLRMEGMEKAAIATRVEEMLALVRLERFGKRMPHQLSGGQRQRVALARALAKKPKLLLLDEPLAALDKKLREETQFELTDLQVELGMTFLIVTHDQDEAMVLADRIAVMDHGRITQIGTPAEVYEAPANRQVAEFLGDINIFEAKVEAFEAPLATLSTEGATFQVNDDCPPPGSDVLLSVRPEKMRISLDAPPPGTPNVIAGEIWDIGYLGDWTNYLVEIGPERLIRVAQANASRLVERPITWDDKVFVSFAPDAGVVLNP